MKNYLFIVGTKEKALELFNSIDKNKIELCKSLLPYKAFSTNGNSASIITKEHIFYLSPSPLDDIFLENNIFFGDDECKELREHLAVNNDLKQIDYSFMAFGIKEKLFPYITNSETTEQTNMDDANRENNTNYTFVATVNFALPYQEELLQTGFFGNMR